MYAYYIGGNVHKPNAKGQNKTKTLSYHLEELHVLSASNVCSCQAEGLQAQSQPRDHRALLLTRAKILFFLWSFLVFRRIVIFFFSLSHNFLRVF